MSLASACPEQGILWCLLAMLRCLIVTYAKPVFEAHRILHMHALQRLAHNKRSHGFSLARTPKTTPRRPNSTMLQQARGRAPSRGRALGGKFELLQLRRPRARPRGQPIEQAGLLPTRETPRIRLPAFRFALAGLTVPATQALGRGLAPTARSDTACQAGLRHLRGPCLHFERRHRDENPVAQPAVSRESMVVRGG